MQKDGRARNWMMSIYPESLPDNWWQVLTEELHLTGAISPLHDQDVEPDGTPKKPHYHLVLTFAGNKSYEQVKAYSDALHGAPPKICENVPGMIRYFSHMDNPEKAQYDRAKIISFGGFHAENYLVLSGAEVQVISKQIREFIRDNQITEFSDLIDIVDQMEDVQTDWLYVLEQRETMFFKAYLQNRHYVAKEGRP